MKRLAIVILLLIAILTSNSFSDNYSQSRHDLMTVSDISQKESIGQNIKLESYVDISGSEIHNNTEFNNFAILHKSSGTGTKIDPIIFDNLHITGNFSMKHITSYFVFKNSKFTGGEVIFEDVAMMNMTNSIFETGQFMSTFSVMNDLNLTGNIFTADVEVIQLLGQTNPRIYGNTFTSIHPATSVRIQSYYNGTLFKTTYVDFEYNQIFSQGLAMYSYVYTQAKYAYNNITIASDEYNPTYGIDMIVQYNHTLQNNNFKYTGSPAYSPSISLRRISGYAQEIKLLNNTFDNFYYGLKITTLKNLIIKYNVFINSDTGIWLKGVNSQSDISFNIFTNVNLGIKFNGASSNILSDNLFENVNIVSLFIDSNNNFFNRTEIKTANWFLYSYTGSSNNTEINSNTSNLQSLGLVLNSDTDVDNYIATNSIPGSGTKSDPFILANINIKGGIGISINTNYTLKFQNVYVENIDAEYTVALSLIGANYSIFENVTIQNSFEGVSIVNSFGINVTGLFLKNISNGGYALTMQDTSNITIEDLNIHTAYKSGIRLLNTNNVEMRNLEIYNTFLKAIIVDNSNVIKIQQAKLINGSTALQINAIDTLIITSSLFDNYNQFVSSTSTNTGIFEDNIFSHLQSMSIFSSSATLNFTNNEFIHNSDYLFNITDGVANFNLNYFINNTQSTQNASLVGTGGTLNFNANYYDTIGSNTQFTVRKDVVDLNPLRPFVDSLTLTYESGSTFFNDLTSGFKQPLNFSTIYYNDMSIGTITWKDHIVSEVLLNYTLIGGYGTYNFVLVTVDIWGVTSDNQSFMITVDDTTSPIISSPNDITFEVEVLTKQIIWIISDLNLGNYSLYVISENTNSINRTDGIASEQIVVDLSGLTVDVYNYTIVVYDLAGNSISDTVIVTVTQHSINYSSPTTNTSNQKSDITENSAVKSSAWIWGVSIIVLLASGAGLFVYKNQETTANYISKIKSKLKK